MELRHIRYFIAVAENMSISRAAQELLIAQPPLSRQIRDLEDELGADLFERTPQGLRITPEGNAFLQYARQIMDLAERSRIHVFEMAKGIQGTIDIASVEGHAPRLIAKWIAAFREGRPNVQYSIRNGSTDDVIYRVTQGLSNLGVITEPLNADGVFSVPVYREPWTAMIPASDPLAKLPGDTVSVSALRDKDLIIPSRESRLQEILDWFPVEDEELGGREMLDDESSGSGPARSGSGPGRIRDGSPGTGSSGSSRGPGRKLKVLCRISHMLNAYELARQGVGIAIYPASDNHFSKDPEVIIKRLVDPEVTASYLLIWDQRHPLPHAAELFVKEVCESLGVKTPK
ncbi:MAG: LysR family transcriptional regulator [Stomatobaculum sp.]|nr:LysR family transcriptional regulator [Stomatobaculum sp.]